MKGGFLSASFGGRLTGKTPDFGSGECRSESYPPSPMNTAPGIELSDHERSLIGLFASIMHAEATEDEEGLTNADELVLSTIRGLLKKIGVTVEQVMAFAYLYLPDEALDDKELLIEVTNAIEASKES